jgi:four helix bundle protein
VTKLDYEKLDVYQLAIEFLALAWEIIEAMPRGRSRLKKQFEEAAFSVPQNIAEGVGKPTDPDRQRFYGIARGSAMECGAILDASRVLKLVDGGRWEKGKTLLVRIVSMLTKMCR